MCSVVAAKQRNYNLSGSTGYCTSADFKFEHRDADEIFREFFGGQDPFEAFFGNKDPFEAFFANTGSVLFRNLFIARSRTHFYGEMLCIRGTSHGPVSVRLSVTSRSSTKTAKRRITQTTPHDSPGTLVF